MKEGFAVANNVRGIPDFTNGAIITMSYGTDSRLITVSKCTRCGWSVTR